MPWRERSPMVERVQFISDYQRQLFTMTELCDLPGHELAGRYRAGEATPTEAFESCLRRIEAVKGLTKRGVLFLAKDERVNGSIALLSDADLERATIRDQPRDMNSRRIFGQTDRLLGWREQRKLNRWVVENGIECVRRQVAIAGHERQLEG